MDVESTRRRTAGSVDDDYDTRALVSGDVLARSGTPDSETTDEEPASHLISDHTGDTPLPKLYIKKQPPWRARYCTEKYQKVATIIMVLVLGLIIIALVSVTFGIYDGMPKRSCSDLAHEPEYAPFVFDAASGEFSLCHNGEPKVSGGLGKGHSFITEYKVDMYSYSNQTELSLSRHNVSKDHCVRVEWKGPSSTDLPIIDCFDITNESMWFGGYETLNQLWPINSDSHKMTPFLPRDFVMDSTVDWFGPILHPVWYNSDGVVLFVDEDVPLHVSINDPSGNNTSSSQLCLQALPYSLSCFPHSSNITSLKYTLCAFESIARAAQFFLNESQAINHPVSSPSLDLFLKPIWSTWAAFKSNISQEIITSFANNITQVYQLGISQLGIDDKYSVEYGELSFDPVKFPNITTMNSTLYSFGVPGISAWITPFVDPKASNFTYMASSGKLLPGINDIDANSISLVKWWNGYSGVINYANKDIRDWIAEKLAKFVSRYSLSGLKFDAGGENYVPRCVYIDNLTHPGLFSKSYAEFVGQQSYRVKSEVTVGYFNQKEPVLFHIFDFKSDWGLDHGLQSIITTVLSLGIAGYPFILPDTVGGKGYDSEPDSELYVRWLQLNAFLPVMQFSYPPWRYNNDTIIGHTRDMIELHQKLTNDYIKALIDEAIDTGFPIIRPLWWIAPNDQTAITTRDQFLIGDSVLVAPVVLPNSSTRVVYFPRGIWKCMSSGCTKDSIVTGPISIPYTVSLTDVLYFVVCAANDC